MKIYLFAGFAMLCTACAVKAPLLDADVAAIHRQAVVVDSHVDIPPNYATPQADPGKRGDGQVDLPKMREGGVDVVFFVVYVKQGERDAPGYGEAYKAAVAKFDAIARQTALYGDRIGLARSLGEVEALLADGKMVAMIGVENAYPIGTDLSRIAEFHRRGARYMSLTHAGHNDLADSANPIGKTLVSATPEHGGLSAFGRKAIAEMNRVGIMVDVSHASEQTALQAAALSQAPIIASHSAIESLAPIARNLSDAELDAIASTRGVAQIVAFDWYLKTPAREKIHAVVALRKALGLTSAAAFQAMTGAELSAYREQLSVLHEKWPRAGIRDFVDHIDYAVARIGVDHVGIASDFGGGGGIDGWDSAAQTPNVTAEMAQRGYSPADIAKIWGGNLLRVLGEVERVSQGLKRTGD